MGVKRYVALAPPQVGGLMVGFCSRIFPITEVISLVDSKPRKSIILSKKEFGYGKPL